MHLVFFLSNFSVIQKGSSRGTGSGVVVGGGGTNGGLSSRRSHSPLGSGSVGGGAGILPMALPILAVLTANGVVVFEILHVVQVRDIFFLLITSANEIR